MMTAISGGAIIPYLLGVLADRVGIQRSFLLAVLCYLYVAYYGLSGYKRTTDRNQPKA
jgi:MFS transporter, FHS family, L-fucose permease